MHYIVPTVPCGVESLGFLGTGRPTSWFLMYRVELKVEECLEKGKILKRFLMYRVELKDDGL